MEDQERNEFSWTSLFLVTGCCFLGFSIILKLLDGGSVSLFTRIGMVTTGIGVLASINKWLSKKYESSKSRETT